MGAPVAHALGMHWPTKISFGIHRRPHVPSDRPVVKRCGIRASRVRSTWGNIHHAGPMLHPPELVAPEGAARSRSARARTGGELQSLHRWYDAATDRDPRRLQRSIGLGPRRSDEDGGARF
jgi:hypothetical protein